MGYAQLVIGPTGCGKSTYCSSLYDHCKNIGRTMHVVNLDPAAEIFNYPVAMDIREHISLEYVMEKLGHGPNGGLMYCMEYLEDSLHDWVDKELENYRDDDYLIFDCPDAYMIIEFEASQSMFELPHVNILSKMDLLDKSNIDDYLDPEPRTLLAELNQRMNPKFAKLNKALIEMYGMVNFLPLDLRKKRSIQYVLSQIDICIQFGEDADVKFKDEDKNFW